MEMKLLWTAILAVIVGIVPSAFQNASAQIVELNETTTWTDPRTGLVHEILATGEYCLDMNNDSICDVTFIDGKMVFDERPVVQPTPTPPVDEKFPLNQSRGELEKLISETGNQTQLIWNCTMPDSKTQCFTKILDNGTILVANGKPDPVEVTTTGEYIDYSGVPITETPYGETYEEADESIVEPAVEEAGLLCVNF